MVLDALLYSLSFYAWATAGLSIILYSLAFFSKKFGIISTFILSIVIYISAPFGGRSSWFAEKFGWITEQEREYISIIWVLMLCVAGTLSVRYLLVRQDPQQIKQDALSIKGKTITKQVWQYVVSALILAASIIFFMRLLYEL